MVHANTQIKSCRLCSPERSHPRGALLCLWQVEVSTLDVANLDDAHALLRLANAQAPVGGVFHLAMILHDRFLTNQVDGPDIKTLNFKKPRLKKPSQLLLHAGSDEVPISLSCCFTWRSPCCSGATAKPGHRAHSR